MPPPPLFTGLYERARKQKMSFLFGCGAAVILSHTCGKSRLGRGLGHYDGEGGGGWRRLGPGQGAVAGEADR